MTLYQLFLHWTDNPTSDGNEHILSTIDENSIEDEIDNQLSEIDLDTQFLIKRVTNMDIVRSWRIETAITKESLNYQDTRECTFSYLTAHEQKVGML
jgi:hypothetical protein